MKRILSAAALSLACATASAALVNQPAHQLVPIFNGGVDIGLTGGWFEPVYHHIGLVVKDTSRSNPGQADGRLVDIDPDFAFSYGAYIGWRFACTGNDIRLHYFNVCTDDTRKISNSGGQPILWTVVGMVDNDDYIDRAKRATGKLEFDMHRWDLEYAQHINFCSRASMRFFFGASYHCVEKKRNITYIGDPAYGDGGKRETAKLESEFDGYGPRFGVDFDYAFNHGFGLVASFSSSLLYGEICSETRITRTDIPNETTRISLDRCIIVPNFDLKIGVDYSYGFCNGSIAKVEAGWWVNSYVNAVNDTHFISATNDANHDNRLDNIAYSGLYLTVAYSS